MNNVLSSKILTPEEGIKLINDFDITDYAVRDSSEIKTVISLLEKMLSDIDSQIEDLSRSSGSAELLVKRKTIYSISKSLLKILSERVSDAEAEDKSLVKLTKDDMVQVVDNGESRYETTEVIDSLNLFFYEVKYRFASVEGYNEATGSNKTEEEYYYELLNKFVDLSLEDCFKVGKRRLSDLEASVVSDIIEKNYQWHTLVDVVGADTVRLNSSLKLYPEKRNELLNLSFVIKERVAKTKVPTNVQMSLFDDYEDEEINVLLEGGLFNEEE